MAISEEHAQRLARARAANARKTDARARAILEAFERGGYQAVAEEFDITLGSAKTMVNKSGRRVGLTPALQARKEAQRRVGAKAGAAAQRRTGLQAARRMDRVARKGAIDAVMAEFGITRDNARKRIYHAQKRLDRYKAEGS